MRPAAIKRALKRRLLFACAVAVCCQWLPASGFCAPCTSLTSVVNSAMVSNNSAAGGHLLEHITGAAPPSPFTQRHATMFANAAQFTTVWNSFVTNGATVNCAEGAADGAKVAEQVAFASLKSGEEDTLQVCQCTAQVDVNRSCQRGYFNFSTTITFVFAVVKNQWILLTAYPQYGLPTTDACVNTTSATKPKR